MADAKIGVTVEGNTQAESDLGTLSQKIEAVQTAAVKVRTALASGDALGLKAAVAEGKAAVDTLQAEQERLSTESFETQKRAILALSQFDQAASNAVGGVKRLGDASRQTGIDVDRMAERISIRVAILALLNAEAKAASVEVGKLGEQFVALARDSGVGAEALVKLEDIFEEFAKGDFHKGIEGVLEGLFTGVEALGVKAQFLAAMLGDKLGTAIQKVSAQAGNIPGLAALGAALRAIGEGTGNVTLAEVELARSIDELEKSANNAKASLQDRLSIQLKFADALRTDASVTDAARLAEVQRLEALRKLAAGYPDLIAQIDAAIRATQSESAAMDELAKAMGTKTAKQIDDLVFSIVNYRNEIGSAADATREASDILVKKSQDAVKAIEELPVKERAVYKDRLEQLHLYISEYSANTTTYEKESAKQEAAAEKLAVSEAKSLDQRRKNYESAFNAIASAIDKFEDQLSPKGNKGVSSLTKELADLVEERDRLASEPQTSLEGSNRLAELSGLIGQKQFEVAEATRKAKAEVVSFADQAGPALAKVTDFLDRNILSSEKFHKVYAEQSPATQAAIESIVEGLQRTAQNADLAGKALTGQDFEKFRQDLSDIFKGAGGEASEFADNLLKTSNTIRGSFDNVSTSFDRMRKDQTTITEGEKAVGDAFKGSKTEIDAETDSLNANSDAKERNVAADGAIGGGTLTVPGRPAIGTIPVGPGPSPDTATPESGPGGGTLSVPGRPAIGTIPVGTVPPPISPETVSITVDSGKKITGVLDTLRKDGLLPVAEATTKVATSTVDMSGAQAEAAKLSKDFQEQVAKESALLGNEGDVLAQTTEGFQQHVTTIQEVAAASKAAGGAIADANTSLGETAAAVEGAAAGLQDLGDGADAVAGKVADTAASVSQSGESLARVAKTERDVADAGDEIHPKLQLIAQGFKDVESGATTSARQLGVFSQVVHDQLYIGTKLVLETVDLLNAALERFNSNVKEIGK